MVDDCGTEVIPSIIPLTSNENEIELYSIVLSNDSQSINSNRSSTSEKSKSVPSRFKNLVKKFDCLNVEKRGIERVSPEDRTDSKIINTGMIWVGANMIIPCFTTGTLGPSVFKLSLYDSFIIIIIFNLIGIIPIAVMACFGPASGLRTMVFSRYSWGYYGASFIAIINAISALGWASVNSITGAQTLRVVSDNGLPMSIGIIIISIISMIVSLVGYKWIHTYERYSWIPMFIGYCIVAGLGAKYFTHSEMVNVNGTMSMNVVINGRLELSRLLSFASVCFGVSSSWCSFAGDYNTYFPENTNQLKIFLITYIGNVLSIIPLELLGAAVFTGTYINQDWNHAYEQNNVGGLLGATLSPLGGFGKFILILFSLSTIACNIPNIYSLSLSAQVIAPIFERIPRIIYTIVGTIIYIILGIIASNCFNDAVVSFMDVVSYWISIFIVIVFEDHLFFRCCSYKNYNFDIWDKRQMLPISFSAIFSGLIGIVGIALGMSQSWFNGPIAKLISGDNSEQGADVGFELGFIFTAITFPLFRLIELHYIKR